MFTFLLPPHTQASFVEKRLNIGGKRIQLAIWVSSLWCNVCIISDELVYWYFHFLIQNKLSTILSALYIVVTSVSIPFHPCVSIPFHSRVSIPFHSHVSILFHSHVSIPFQDTAGQERYHALGPIYYRDSQGAIIVYDITDEDSFHKVLYNTLKPPCNGQLYWGNLSKQNTSKPIHLCT